MRKQKKVTDIAYGEIKKVINLLSALIIGNQQLFGIGVFMDGILNEDYVLCPICGKEGKRIYKHIVKVHCMSLDEFHNNLLDIK